MMMMFTITTAATHTAWLISIHLLYNKHPTKAKYKIAIWWLVVEGGSNVDSTITLFIMHYMTIYGKYLRKVNQAKCCRSISQCMYSLSRQGQHKLSYSSFLSVSQSRLLPNKISLPSLVHTFIYYSTRCSCYSTYYSTRC